MRRRTTGGLGAVLLALAAAGCGQGGATASGEYPSDTIRIISPVRQVGRWTSRREPWPPASSGSWAPR